MFDFDNEFDLPPMLVDDSSDTILPDDALCPKNYTVPVARIDNEGVMQGSHQWEQVYRDNRPNSENDDLYTIYRCVFCRRYNSRWESRQFNSPPANTR